MIFSVKKFDELNTFELYEILKARAEVFVAEQKITCADPDGADPDCIHCMMWEDGKLAAYMRAFVYAENTAKIGRVLTRTRGKGHGAELMRLSVPEIKKILDCEKIVVSAQTQALGFYEKTGFIAISEEYLEEGVPHVKMELKEK